MKKPKFILTETFESKSEEERREKVTKIVEHFINIKFQQEQNKITE